MQKMETTRNRPDKTSPKYVQVRDRIRRRILDGEWAAGMRLPPETELPGLLKTSKITVVRALNDLVQEGYIVRRRGSGSYVAERPVPPILPGQHLKLGILWNMSVLPERIGKGFSGSMTRGLLREWCVDGVEPKFDPVDEHTTTRAVFHDPRRSLTVECIGESSFSRERHPELSVIRDGGFDGLLTLSIIEEDWLSALLDLGIPTILVDFPSDRLSERADQVFVDAQPGYRAAVRHLAGTGLRRIHFMGQLRRPPATAPDMSKEEYERHSTGRYLVDPDTYLRLGAYRQAMEECGVPVEEGWVHHASSKPGMLEQLAEKIIEEYADQLPESFVCHGDAQGRKLIEVFARYGHRIRAVGAGERNRSADALSVMVKGEDVGSTAAGILALRLQRPHQPFLNVGVKMAFDPTGSKTNSTVSKAGRIDSL